MGGVNLVREPVQMPPHKSRRKPVWLTQAEVFPQRGISADLTRSVYNLLTGCKFPCFHVSVSAYKRSNGASCRVCLRSQMLINCVRMKVEGFSSLRGPVLNPNVYARLSSQQPGVISSIKFKHGRMLMCSVEACCFHVGLFPFLRSALHPWIMKKGL